MYQSLNSKTIQQSLELPTARLIRAGTPVYLACSKHLELYCLAGCLLLHSNTILVTIIEHQHSLMKSYKEASSSPGVMLVHALARSRKLRMLLCCWVTLSFGRLIGATARTYKPDC